MPANFFTTQVDYFETKLALSRLRRVLDLPKGVSFPGRQQFEDVAYEEEMCSDIISLGYRDVLDKDANFKRKHCDYDVLLWNELIEVFLDKSKPNKAKKFVPFQRFLQIFIQSMMAGNDEIPKRESSVKETASTMMFLKLIELYFSYVLPIPEDLLAYADQRTESVISYKRENMNVRDTGGSDFVDSAANATEDIALDDVDLGTDDVDLGTDDDDHDIF
ncbi:hypothetical protein L6452_05457 [Arctium lappa]|uniref:Uncharacterized protein n=1 Tax=Arctium lappa TaxID=4217 RepID=A0ACB9EFW7_ARCLA|nr:hypothetical protein L6452_05457 [Arctium lappa]